MRKTSEMLFLLALVSLLYWTQTQGCSGPLVVLSVDEVVNGKSLQLSCEFTCLTPKYFAQLWRDSQHGEVKDKVSLLNITATHQNVTLVLRISSATKVDTGNYSCSTEPPDTISPSFPFVVSSKMLMQQVPDYLTTPSTQLCGTAKPQSSAAGLQSQMWFWILLGKNVILFINLTFLAAKYRNG